MPQFETWPFALCFAISLSLGVVLTFLMRWLAPRVGMVDHPVGRKDHARSTPLLGGVAVYGAAIVGYTLIAQHDARTLWVIAGGFLVLALGVWDDRVGLRARVRLAVQLVAASGVFFAGLGFGWFPWPVANYLVTVIWLVGMMNAMNCLDCADGAAAGVAAIGAGTCAAIAIFSGHFAVALLAAALAGACLGFLTLNFPPASIFLGDAGSTSLGLLLGSLAIAGSRNVPPLEHVWVIGLPLAIPVWDITLVHLRRYRAGTRGLRALLESAGRDHLPHRLRELGLSARGSAVTLYAMAITLAVPAVLVAYYRLDAVLVAMGGALLLVMVGERPFAEATLQLSRWLPGGRAVLAAPRPGLPRLTQPELVAVGPEAASSRSEVGP